MKPFAARYFPTRSTAWAVLLVLVSACGGGGGSSDPLLARVGEARLYRSELSSKMPGGLSQDDSVKFSRLYVRGWIERNLLSEVATDKIDMRKIDKMVDEYRTELIMWEYRNRMFDSDDEAALPEDSLRAYYATHAKDFRLQYPLVKGLYLKVPDDIKVLPSIRRLYKSTSTSDLDILEKYGLGNALHFDYFGDTWIDWQQIEARIPYDFGNDINQFLRSHNTLEVEKDGYVYLLRIDSITPAGDTMPYSSARRLIVDRLTAQRRADLDARLSKRLLDDATKNGKIEILCDIGQ